MKLLVSSLLLASSVNATVGDDCNVYACKIQLECCGIAERDDSYKDPTAGKNIAKPGAIRKVCNTKTAVTYVETYKAGNAKLYSETETTGSAGYNFRCESMGTGASMLKAAVSTMAGLLMIY